MRFTPSAVLATLFLATSVFAQRMTTTLDVEVRQSAMENLCHWSANCVNRMATLLSSPWLPMHGVPPSHRLWVPSLVMVMMKPAHRLLSQLRQRGLLPRRKWLSRLDSRLGFNECTVHGLWERKPQPLPLLPLWGLPLTGSTPVMDIGLTTLGLLLLPRESLF